jgi:nitrite reductase/ring-hydroxylating ferredoxin subunit
MSEQTTTRESADVMPDVVLYAICAMSDIPSQKARGFNLVRLDDDDKEEPFPIVIVRWGKYVFGYVNKCPHHDVNLDWERNAFLEPNYGLRLMCGKHGALFEIGTGACIEGPCKGRGLAAVDLAVVDNEICIIGVRLAENDA